MGELSQNVSDLCRSRRSTDSDEESLIGGANDQVGANTVCLGTGPLDHANHDAHDGEDHGHLDGHREYADRRTQRTVEQIAED
jgi:hypothetical protein